MIERGAIRVQPIDLGNDTWSGVRVDIAEGSRFGREFDVMASPKGAKFEIHPRTLKWRAIVVRLPDGSEVDVSFYEDRWHVNVYDPTDRWISSIDQPEPK